MASLSRKVYQQHKYLLIKFCEMMSPDDPAYKNFILYLQSEIPKGNLLSVQQSPLDVLVLMEEKGILKVGKYGALKKALKASGYIDVLDCLKNEEKSIARQMRIHSYSALDYLKNQENSIARQMRLHSYSDGAMAGGSSNIEAVTSSSMKPEEGPKNISTPKVLSRNISLNITDAIFSNIVTGDNRHNAINIGSQKEDGEKSITRQMRQYSYSDGAMAGGSSKIGVKGLKRRLDDDEDEPASKRIMFKKRGSSYKVRMMGHPGQEYDRDRPKYVMSSQYHKTRPRPEPATSAPGGMASESSRKSPKMQIDTAFLHPLASNVRLTQPGKSGDTTWTKHRLTSAKVVDNIIVHQINQSPDCPKPDPSESITARLAASSPSNRQSSSDNVTTSKATEKKSSTASQPAGWQLCHTVSHG